MFDDSFVTVYVDDYLMIRVQHSDDDTTAQTMSASLGSGHVRMFGSEEVGATPIQAPNKNTDWDTKIDALGFTIDPLMLRILHPCEKNEAIEKLLCEHWPTNSRQAKSRGVLSMAGNLWKLTYVMRNGRCFLWRLLQLTGLHDEQDPRNTNLGRLGSELHADLSSSGSGR